VKVVSSAAPAAALELTLVSCKYGLRDAVLAAGFRMTGDFVGLLCEVLFGAAPWSFLRENDALSSSAGLSWLHGSQLLRCRHRLTLLDLLELLTVADFFAFGAAVILPGLLAFSKRPSCLRRANFLRRG